MNLHLREEVSDFSDKTLRRGGITSRKEVNLMVTNGERANRMQVLQGQNTPFVMDTVCDHFCNAN